jgi:hypothetical protein
MSRYFEAIADAIGDGVDRVDGNALAVAGGVTAASALVWYLFRKSSKPSFTQLGGGSLDSGKIQTEVRARPRRRALRRRRRVVLQRPRLAGSSPAIGCCHASPRGALPCAGTPRAPPTRRRAHTSRPPPTTPLHNHRSPTTTPSSAR